MPARLHPGVYVEEVPSGARSIEAGSTSTAILVGETERGPVEPTLIKGELDYERLFGGYWRADASGTPKRATLRYAVSAFFRNGGGSAYVLRAIAPNPVLGFRTVGAAKVVAASPGAWSSSVRAVFCQSGDADPQRFQIAVAYQAPGATSPRIVERWDRLSAAPDDENYVVDVLRRSAFIRWDPSTAAALPNPLDDASTGPTDAALAQIATAALGSGSGGDADLAASAYPTLLSGLDEVTDASLLVVPIRVNETQASEAQGMVNAALAYAEGRPQQDLFVVADMLRCSGTTPTGAVPQVRTQLGSFTLTTFGAVYFPWLEVPDPAGQGKDPTVFLPPSAFVAGLYARTDARRGVWKAPAGIDASVLGARRLEYKLLDAHQDDLNPLGVNLLRVQPAGGLVVWGARTLKPGSEWRYVNVRRTAIFLRKSIYNGIQWAVFEPNDEPLWANLRLTIGAFLEQQFRQGAFAGQTTREAFFVKCDAETTTEADRAAGIVNVLVGFAPLRPAEFVVVRISQIVNQKSA